MIPTVEDILRGMAKGSIKFEQAMAWMEEHFRMAQDEAAASLPESQQRTRRTNLLIKDVPEQLRTIALLELGRNSHTAKAVVLDAADAIESGAVSGCGALPAEWLPLAWDQGRLMFVAANGETVPPHHLAHHLSMPPGAVSARSDSSDGLIGELVEAAVKCDRRVCSHFGLLNRAADALCARSTTQERK